MTLSGKLAVGAAFLVALTPVSVRADYDEFIGRTGLPTVLEGKNNVWLESGTVRLELRGNDLLITQTFKLQYPGRDVEDEPARIKVAVREDYFRTRDAGTGKVRTGEAEGFKRFSVTVDGRTVATGKDPWRLNSREDTATRWRTWWIGFQPGQQREMRIVSVSPLGREGNRRSVEFVSKDLGKWRGNPDYLEIRFEAPGRMETTLAGIEPTPDNQNRRGARWVYRKASPNRNVFVLLPSTYPRIPRAGF